MSDDYTYKDAFIHHKNMQNKFDYYFLGIVLAALSLSIQTYDSSVEYASIYLIFLSWGLFVVSFLTGFFRQERLNLAYMMAAEKIPTKKKKEMFENAKDGLISLQKPFAEEWTQDEIEKSLEEHSGALKVCDNYLKIYERQTLLAYQIQKWSFIYASFFYILFKVVNSITVSTLWISITTAIVVIINFIVVKIYKHYLHKNVAS